MWHSIHGSARVSSSFLKWLFLKWADFPFYGTKFYPTYSNHSFPTTSTITCDFTKQEIEFFHILNDHIFVYVFLTFQLYLTANHYLYLSFVSSRAKILSHHPVHCTKCWLFTLFYVWNFDLKCRTFHFNHLKWLQRLIWNYVPTTNLNTFVLSSWTLASTCTYSLMTLSIVFWAYKLNR